MTKEQYLKVIETIINSPRNDTQKITMLKYSFETYVKDCNKKFTDSGIIGEFIGKEITVDYLQKILNDYFDIPNDTYAYNLTRDKHAFMCGTMGFDDFEEFDEDTTRDLAEYIIKCFNT